MRKLQWFILCMFAFLLVAAPQPTSALNCKPDTRTIVKVFLAPIAPNGFEEAFWIDVDSLHVCLYDSSHGLQDLTSLLGFPTAASPVLSVSETFQGGSNGEITSIYVVNSANHLIQVAFNPSAENFQIFDLTNTTGQMASPWTSVAASQNSVAFAVDHPNDGLDKYGVRKSVWRFDFGSGRSGTNLYSAVGRSVEHLETQVNIVFDAAGKAYTTFDPEGQGHIHFISSLTGGSTGSFQHLDLMDSTGVGSMNVTTGGGIVPPNLPTCEASGVAPASLVGSSGANANLIFYGTDTDFHHLSGTGTSWQKRDITHESGAPHADGCGQFSAAFNVQTLNLLYEAIVSGGRGLVQASLVPNQSWTFQIVVQPSGGTLCSGNVATKSPLAIVTDFSAVSHYYYLDANNHFFRDCNIIIN